MIVCKRSRSALGSCLCGWVVPVVQCGKVRSVMLPGILCWVLGVLVNSLRRVVMLGMAWLLVACGGTGVEPAVTGVRAQTLQYGRTAVIQVGGNDLRSTLQADLGPGCSSPVFSSSSTPNLAVLNCAVTAVGDLPLTIRTASGELLYQTTLKVPNPQVQLSTSKGNITLELDPTKAPVTVNNFLAYVRAGYYMNTIFHRVIAGFVVQGGGFTSGMQLKSGLKDPIALESRNGLSNLHGTVAMARAEVPDSATSQFFVNLVDNTRLDYQDANNLGYAVFGKVVQGMDVVDTIAKEPTGAVGLFEDVPLTDVTINLAIQIK